MAKNTKISNSCCTWKDEANCIDCSLQDTLNCRWDNKLLLRFFYVFSPAFLFISIGIILGAIKLGNWWWFGVIIGYFALFFIVETRILCSHCPFYSEEGKILHCLANQGFIKYCNYHPEPMNKFEKRLLLTGFVLFGAVPLSNQIINVIMVTMNQESFTLNYQIVLWIILGLTAISIGFGFLFLSKKICIDCINFSCPLNKVKKQKIDEYLRKNPTMLKAWLDCGYKLEE